MATSFSAAAKAEICRSIPNKNCCALAECFGILLFCNSFDHECIRIITESREFAYVLPKQFKRAFDVEFDFFRSMVAPGKLIFQITDPEKLDIIFSACGFSRDNTLAMHLNLPIVEEECCRSAFLRGAFLAGGSVTDPEKAYHLELTTTHQTVAREAYTLIHEVLTFYPKMAARGGGSVLYLKQSDQISDFLACLGASVASMGIIEAKLEKELNNKVNRRCNCDDANTSKVVEAAQEQLTAIRILRERKVADKLPHKLQQALIAREKNPEASLSELAGMMEPPISKPAMNHRLKKLVELSKEETA
jgi:DNA-binding protein WhiA